jgi:transcriptional regulator with XRE-family HTH domain
MNDYERQICSRVGQLREGLKQPQRNFAKLLGISHDKLASIEYGRTPLRFETALAAATLTGCNLAWLAEGINPKLAPLPSPSVTGKIPSQRLFSEAWKQWLKGSPVVPPIKTAKGSATSVDNEPIAGASHLDYLVEEVSGTLNFLPPEFHQNYFAHIAKGGQDFVAMNLAAINESKLLSTNSLKTDLTKAATSNKVVAVKPQLPNLRERLNRATSESGQMSALAKFLKVPLASVSRWLSGKREPGGEITLQMQEWVKARERQK